MTKVEANKKQQIEELVYTAIGQASMCWLDTPEGRVFDSTKAKEVADKLIADIHKDTVMIVMPTELVKAYQDVGIHGSGSVLVGKDGTITHLPYGKELEEIDRINDSKK